MTFQTAVAAANTSTVITLTPADPTVGFKLYAIYYSYVGGTVTGTLTVAEGSANLIVIQTAATGEKTLPFPPYRTKSGATVTITLAAGGVGVVGNLTVLYSLE